LHTLFIVFTQYYNRDYKGQMNKGKIENWPKFSFYIFCKYYCMTLPIDKKNYLHFNEE